MSDTSKDLWLPLQGSDKTRAFSPCPGVVLIKSGNGMMAMPGRCKLVNDTAKNKEQADYWRIEEVFLVDTIAAEETPEPELIEI